LGEPSLLSYWYKVSLPADKLTRSWRPVLRIMWECMKSYFHWLGIITYSYTVHEHLLY